MSSHATLGGAKQLFSFGLVIFVALAGCGRSSPKGKALSSTQAAVSPSTGSIAGGTVVTITGSDFTSDTTVSFGNTPAKTTVLGNVAIQAISPPAAGPGAVDILISNHVGKSVLTGAFTYVLPALSTPASSAIKPGTGSVLGGTTITITGTTFTPTTAVTIGGAVLTIVSVSTDGTTIVGRTPASAVAGAADVVLREGSGSTTFPGVFTYTIGMANGVPNPTHGSVLGGDTITVTGQFFQPSDAVSIGGVPLVSQNFVNDTTITGTTAAHAAGAAVITIAEGGFTTQGSTFTYTSGTAVSVTADATGLHASHVAGGDNITIIGTDFRAGDQVFIGANALISPNLTGVPTKITGKAPPSTVAGAVDVRVVEGTNTQTLVGGYTYLAGLPLAILPNSGPIAGGQSVVITGQDFIPADQVFIGGQPLGSQVVVSATAITGFTPSVSTIGFVDVTVIESGVTQKLPLAYNYGIGQITAISPAAGPMSGLTSVTVTGFNFTANSTIFIGANQLQNQAFVTATAITGRTPASSLAGQVDVVNKEGGAQNALKNAFNYLAPTIDASGGVTVNNSTTALTDVLSGGAPIKVTGSNFGQNTVIKINGKPLDSPIPSAGAITGNVPASTVAGSFLITAEEGTASNAFGSLFTYTAPTIASITPATGPMAGSTPVTVSGTSFGKFTKIQINGIPLVSPSRVDPQTITGLTPVSLVHDSVDVTVTEAGQTWGVLTRGYTYTIGKVLAIAPSSGTVDGNTSVTVTGVNFNVNSRIFIGANPLQGPVLVSPTAITGRTPASSVAGQVDVSNHENGATDTLQNAFTYVAGTIDTVTVNGGSTLADVLSGGSPIVVTGTSFGPSTVIKINGVLLESASRNGNTVTGVVPASSVAGSFVITAETAGIATTFGSLFTYNAPGLTSINPNAGTVAGGTPVTIVGTSFGRFTKITIGGLALVAPSRNGNTITGTTPVAVARGAADVAVVEASTIWATLTGVAGFTYNGGTLLSIQPNIGHAAGRTFVKVTGQNFYTATNVLIDGNPITASIVAGQFPFLASSQLIQGLTPQGATTGAVNVTITDATGAEVDVGKFTYIAAQVTSISPNVGSAKGGTKVLLTGTDFTSDAKFTVDGVPLFNVSLLSSTQAVGFTNPSTIQDPAKLPRTVDVAVTEGAVTQVLKNAFTFIGVEFVAIPNAGSSDVTVVKLEDFAQTPPIVEIAAGSPFGLGLKNPDPVGGAEDTTRGLLFTTNFADGSVTSFSASTSSLTGYVRVANPTSLGTGSHPTAALVDELKQVLYIADAGRRSLIAVTYTATGALTIGSEAGLSGVGAVGPSSLAFTSKGAGGDGHRSLFVGDKATSDIFRVDYTSDGFTFTFTGGTPTFFRANSAPPVALAFKQDPVVALDALYAAADSGLITKYPIASGEIDSTRNITAIQAGATGQRSMLLVDVGPTVTGSAIPILYVADATNDTISAFSVAGDDLTTLGAPIKIAGAHPKGLSLAGNRLVTGGSGTSQIFTFDIAVDGTISRSTNSPFAVGGGLGAIAPRTNDGLVRNGSNGVAPIFAVNERTGNASAFQVAFTSNGLELNEYTTSPIEVVPGAGITGGLFTAGELFLGAGTTRDLVEAFSADPSTGFLTFFDEATAATPSAANGNIKLAAIASTQDPGFPTLLVGIQQGATGAASRLGQAGSIVTYLVDRNGTVASAVSPNANPFSFQFPGGQATGDLTNAIPIDFALLDQSDLLVLYASNGASGTGPGLSLFAIAADGGISQRASKRMDASNGTRITSMFVEPPVNGTSEVYTVDSSPALTKFLVTPTTSAIVIVAQNIDTGTAPNNFSLRSAGIVRTAPFNVTHEAVYVVGVDDDTNLLSVFGFETVQTAAIGVSLPALPHMPYPIHPAIAAQHLRADDAVVIGPFLYIAVGGVDPTGKGDGQNFIMVFAIQTDGSLLPVQFTRTLAPAGQFPTGGTGKQKLSVINGRLFVVTAGSRDGVADPGANNAVLVLDVDPLSGEVSKVANVSVSPASGPVDAILMK